MTDRCYKCGRIKPPSRSVERRLKAFLGGDGWRKAEVCPECEGSGIEAIDAMTGKTDPCLACSRHNCTAGTRGTGKRLGTDPDILCPECEEAERG